MPVHIKGHILTSGGALVDITDRGIGMTAKEMAYANQQLDNPPAADIDVPKWMGLLVVARLAARHGIRVRLNQAELGGLTALVWLPDEILTHYSAAADPGRAAEQRGAAVELGGLCARAAPGSPGSRPRPGPIRPGRPVARRPRCRSGRPRPSGPPRAPTCPAGTSAWSCRRPRARRERAGCPSSMRSSRAGPGADAKQPARRARLRPRPVRPARLGRPARRRPGCPGARCPPRRPLAPSRVRHPARRSALVPRPARAGPFPPKRPVPASKTSPDRGRRPSLGRPLGRSRVHPPLAAQRSLTSPLLTANDSLR